MRKCLRFSIICNIIIGTAMTGFYLLFRRNVIELFINDAQVIDLGVKMLLALMASGPVIGIMFVLNFSFKEWARVFKYDSFPWQARSYLCSYALYYE